MPVKGINNVLTAYRRFESDIQNRVKNEVFTSAEDIEFDAIQAVPVDTGGLRGSIIKQPENGGFSFKVMALKDYAAYVEFGAGENVDIPEGLEGYARQWYVNGKGRIHARPFLFPAYEKNRAEFVANLKKILGA